MSRLRRLFSRSSEPSAPQVAPSQDDARRATTAHFEEFVRTRVGVEAFLEPPTNATAMTMLLVATTGEWTRRRVPDERAARSLADSLGIPVYDARRTGYPQRMRDWNSRQRAGRRTGQA
ncbi:oxidoreductase [Luteimicrobium subarcticum]|uniref:Uncharacterized protein n=1 Tax=Luteimicrobium subarcticum TaxID=620910 RepID=A0A2M8WRC3_9MICO|nr:oxidoreductase [Luteimicrobium subarcticum]PJI93468.1 hypothetical protein CLV34_2042 [Luteimicrobium subarcticum]